MEELSTYNHGVYTTEDIASSIAKKINLRLFDSNQIRNDKIKNTGAVKIETKSRYEVISELEDKKRALIKERDSFEDAVLNRERHIKCMKRDMQDVEEELADFKKSIDGRKDTIKELITSIDDSLKRLSDLSSSQSQKK